jgi:hypothetical protein
MQRKLGGASLPPSGGAAQHALFAAPAAKPSLKPASQGNPPRQARAASQPGSAPAEQAPFGGFPLTHAFSSAISSSTAAGGVSGSVNATAAPSVALLGVIDECEEPDASDGGETSDTTESGASFDADGASGPLDYLVQRDAGSSGQDGQQDSQRHTDHTAFGDEAQAIAKAGSKILANAVNPLTSPQAPGADQSLRKQAGVSRVLFLKEDSDDEKLNENDLQKAEKEQQQFRTAVESGQLDPIGNLPPLVKRHVEKLGAEQGMPKAAVQEGSRAVGAAMQAFNYLMSPIEAEFDQLGASEKNIDQSKKPTGRKVNTPAYTDWEDIDFRLDEILPMDIYKKSVKEGEWQERHITLARRACYVAFSIHDAFEQRAFAAHKALEDAGFEVQLDPMLDKPGKPGKINWKWYTKEGRESWFVSRFYETDGMMMGNINRHTVYRMLRKYWMMFYGKMVETWQDSTVTHLADNNQHSKNRIMNNSRPEDSKFIQWKRLGDYRDLVLTDENNCYDPGRLPHVYCSEAYRRSINLVEVGNTLGSGVQEANGAINADSGNAESSVDDSYTTGGRGYMADLSLGQNAEG